MGIHHFRAFQALTGNNFVTTALMARDVAETPQTSADSAFPSLLIPPPSTPDFDQLIDQAIRVFSQSQTTTTTPTSVTHSGDTELPLEMASCRGCKGYVKTV